MMRHTKASDRICITGMGMVTSLGLDLATSCAAARAGLTRLSELKVLNFTGDQMWGNEPVVGHCVPGIADGFVGIAKVLILGYHALKDLLSRRKISSDELNRTGIYINLSDQFFLDAHAADEHESKEINLKEYTETEGEGIGDGLLEKLVLPSIRWKEQCSKLIPRLLSNCGLSIPLMNQRLYFGNHVSIINAIEDATKNIQLGLFDRCIIGGIDSCVEPSFLITTASAGVLKTSANPIGFLPGEAASFFLLEKFNEVNTKEVGITSLLGHTALRLDKSNRFSDDHPKGVALAQTIESVLLKFNKPIQEMGFIIGDLNGDNYRAEDWGYALVRLQAKYRLGDLPLWLPAGAFGEIGAATGSVTICLATMAFHRRYVPGTVALIWLSSENGSKGALYLDALPG